MVIICEILRLLGQPLQKLFKFCKNGLKMTFKGHATKNENFNTGSTQCAPFVTTLFYDTLSKNILLLYKIFKWALSFPKLLHLCWHFSFLWLPCHCYSKSFNWSGYSDPVSTYCKKKILNTPKTKATVILWKGCKTWTQDTCIKYYAPDINKF